MSCLLLESLSSKGEIDDVIRSTQDLVLVLRFGKENDPTCMQLDHILAKSIDAVSKMAKIFIVDVDAVPVYTQYFDISLIPSTIFFFNAQHIKVDWGTADHTKFIGTFKCKQDLFDVIETVYRGAMKGKLVVRSPLDPASLQHYELVYKDI